MDFSKNEGKELCKHIIWILLYVCRMPEESELLQQVFLTDAECSEIFGNTPPVPNGLKYVPGARNSPPALSTWEITRSFYPLLF
jgi:hypothetical protein